MIEINNKISNELNTIFKNKNLIKPIMEYLKSWSYNIEEYDLVNVVKDGVHFEVSKTVFLKKENNDLILNDNKNSIKVPSEYQALTEFSFEKKLLNMKMLKDQFSELPQSTILKFVEAMKKMRVFL